MEKDRGPDEISYSQESVEIYTMLVFISIDHNLCTCWCEGDLNIFYAITLVSRLYMTFKNADLVKEQK